MKKNDIILIMTVLVFSLAAYLGIRSYQGIHTKEATAVVTVGEKEYGRFLLSRDTIEKIELPDGSYNILEIKNGKADITQASCPDGICVKHKPISRQKESIVCLPNKVVVEIRNGEEAALDSVVN